MPDLSEFDLSEPAVWPIAADVIQDGGDDALAAVLRALVISPQTDPERIAWDLRYTGFGPLPDTRDNRAYWPERVPAYGAPRLVVYRLPELVGRPVAWVAEVYQHAPGSLRNTFSFEHASPAEAVIQLARAIRGEQNPRGRSSLATVTALAELATLAPTARVVSVRLGSERRPDWWERA